MRWIRNSYWFWMASSFFDPANISRNHSSSSSKTLSNPINQDAAMKPEIQLDTDPIGSKQRRRREGQSCRSTGGPGVEIGGEVDEGLRGAAEGLE